MRIIASIEDLRKLARRRVPRMFYEYVDGGAWSEQTYRENREDFERIHLRQRVAIDVSSRSTATRMVGATTAMPLAIAPTGLTGMVHADGEILAAQAAEKFGVPYTLSTVSICSLEEVARYVNSPFWFQLYVMRDRDFVDRLIDRAAAVGCSALVVTLDLPLSSKRHKDTRNGLSSPPRPTISNVLNLVTKPAWCVGMMQTRRRSFGNLVGHVQNLDNLDSLSAWTDKQYDPSLSWADVQHIRDRWQGKLIIKGVLDPEDAVQAVNCGADAIIVSNHGGRQLDGAISSISALAAVVREVGSLTEVHVDGGIQSGQDIFKAIALGAQGTYIGRSMMYGLGAMGARGVTLVLEILQSELEKTMGLCGVTSIDGIGRDNLVLGDVRSMFDA